MAAATRWASQAAQDALLRYNPQRQALAQQIREAGENYGSTVRAARSTAKQTEGSVQRALPQLAAIFSQADAAKQAGATLVSGDLAALPNTGTLANYKAGEAGEVNTQIDNIAKQRASAQSSMVERGTRAREGAQFAQLNAQNVLARTLQSLFSKGRSLSGEQGAFAQSEAAKLAREAEALEQRETASKRTAASSAAGTAQQERASERTARTSRENAREKPGKTGPKYTAPGVKEQDVTQHNKARETIEKIRHEAFNQIRGNHHNYNEALQILQTPIKTKAFSRGAYPDSGQLRAAVDLAYFGGLSGGAIDKLHNEGFGVGRLGYPRYSAPPPPPSVFDLVRNAVGSLGG